MRRSPIVILAAFGALVAWTDAPAGAPSPNDAALTGEAVYLRAVAAMKAEPLPAYVTFHEDVSARNMRLSCTPDGTSLTLKHGDAKAAFDVRFRSGDGAAMSRLVPSNAECGGALLVPTGPSIVALGAPSPGPSASPSAAPADAGPAIIAAVRVEAARFYHVDLVDRETFDDHPVYRLALRAYRDPYAHPLTGMLVDVDSFLIRQAAGEAAGHYVVASGRVAGTVNFDRFGRYWVVRDEHFELAAQAIFVHAHCTVAVTGSDFAFPDDAPGSFPTAPPRAAPAARR